MQYLHYVCKRIIYDYFRRILAKSELCLCVVLVIAFIFGGIMATYQAVNTIFVTHFEMPCYLP